MAKTVKLKQGFDINLVGKPEKKLADISQSETFAIKPSDFPHIIQPKILVHEGDNVKVGTPLLYEKTMADVMFCSPVSGEIVEIKRGARRRVLELKILADKEMEAESFQKYSASELASLSREEAIAHMAKHGVWPQIIQRPYGVVADPSDTPKSIFVSGFDSHPLAPDVAFTLKDSLDYFKSGMDVLKKLTEGEVHLNTNGRDDQLPAQNILEHKFAGPHPAGNVGVQIHHIDPISKGDLIWTVSPYGVAQIGQLFIEGEYPSSQIIAVTGSQVKEPSYIKVWQGTSLSNIIEEMVEPGNNRIISGNALTGESVGAEGYLGYYHHQVTVIPEGDQEEFMGWLLPSAKKLSFHRTLGMFSFLNRKKELVVDTNQHGEHRNFVMTGSFEKVVPMDILPMHLFKAIMAEDFEEMEALGIYEVVEEDIALCEFVDVSKNELQEVLREGIDLIRNS
ncbi:MAG: Na(+)-translocating NADH-quinone reductase subunit A [Cytophagales bacterium]|nr:Na(+)-translocating NADH-quinone reductase subunit A [Cytophagales bacterium]